jgi:hypothetical protein
MADVEKVIRNDWKKFPLHLSMYRHSPTIFYYNLVIDYRFSIQINEVDFNLVKKLLKLDKEVNQIKGSVLYYHE